MGPQELEKYILRMLLGLVLEECLALKQRADQSTVIVSMLNLYSQLEACVHMHVAIELYIIGATVSAFGQGTGLIWLDNVVCQGFVEDRITECNHLPLGVHNCGHDRDVGVSCVLDGLE